MATLIMLGIAAVFLIGGYMKVTADARDEGRAACQAELRAADDKLKAAADALTQETANHIADMVTVAEVTEAQAKTRVVYVQSKGAGDVKRFPIFANQICVLPDESLRNLNAARAGLRRDPPADGVRASGDGQSASVRAPASAGTPDAAVRGARPLAKRDAGGVVHPDAGGRGSVGSLR